MKRVKIKIKVVVIIEIALSILAGVKSNITRIDEKFHDVCGCEHMYMPCTILPESEDEISLENYTEENTKYMFIKNLLTEEEDKLNSQNTTDIIVIENNLHLVNLYYSIYTCFYREEEENGIKKKKYIPYEETTGEEKKMLIASKYRYPTVFSQLEELKMRLENPERSTQVESAIKLMKRSINLIMCHFYVKDIIDTTTMCTRNVQLEEIGLRNTTPYLLFSKEKRLNEQTDLTTLFKYFELKINNIENLVYMNMPEKLITENTDEEFQEFQEIQNVFTEDTKTITTQLMNRKQTYNKKPKEELKNEFIWDIMMFINILTNGKLEPYLYTYINMKELKKEIEKEEVQIKNILVEAVDRCIQRLGHDISIDKVWEEITEEIYNTSHTMEQERIKTEEPSTSKEKKEIAIRLNETLNRIINSANLKISINTEGLKKEAKPWNDDLVELLSDKVVKYSKLNGTEGDLLNEIIADNAQIASTLLNNRQKKYSKYKGTVIIHKLCKNELKQFMNIIKNQAISSSLQTTEEEQIITILENISKQNNETEEEKTIREALEYILLVEDNPEKEHALRKALKNILLRKDTHEEDPNKAHDRKKEEDKSPIATVLSEMKEECQKSKDNKEAEKLIQDRKQEIANISLKKVSILNENSDMIEIIEILREVVERMIDVLVDGTADHKKYNGLSAIEEEINRDKEYIKKNDLISTLDFIIEFVEKYTHKNVNFDNNEYGWLDPISSSYIVQLKKVISKGFEETIDFLTSKDSCDSGITEFLEISSILNQIHIDIDFLKTYDEFWFNPLSFCYHSKPNNARQEPNLTHIYHNNMACEENYKKVSPTEENLKIFKKARTTQDLKAIKEMKNDL